MHISARICAMSLTTTCNAVTCNSHLNQSAHSCAIGAGNAISISSAIWKQLQWESIPMKTIPGLNLRHQLNDFNGEKPELNGGNNQQGEITTQLFTINWQSNLCNSVSAECSHQSSRHKLQSKCRSNAQLQSAQRRSIWMPNRQFSDSIVMRFPRDAMPCGSMARLGPSSRQCSAKFSSTCTR